MKRSAVPARRVERPELRLTAMIDVVFLLLVFFVLTLHIVPPEGNLAMSMPRPTAVTIVSDEPPEFPIRVRVTADNDGELASISLGERPVADFGDLRREMRSIAEYVREAGRTGDVPPVELVCDEQLRYRYCVAAVTAVRGYRDRDGRFVSITDRIGFSPPPESEP